MKKILTLICILLSLPLFAGNDIHRLSAKKDIPFTPPKVEDITLSNGMRCFLLEDHSVPVIEGALLFKGGASFEKKGEYGVGGIMAGLLENGGTAGKSPEEVRDFLYKNALNVSFGIGQESISGGFSGLSDKKDLLLDLLFEMAFSPRFDGSELDSAKKRAIDSIKRRRELSGSIAHDDFRELVYGDNQLGHILSPKDVKKIDRKKISAFHGRFVVPQNAIIAISGDFNKKDILAYLEGLAKKYPSTGTPAETPPSFDLKDAAWEKRVQKKFTQSAISVGHLGGTRDNPDKYAIVLLNDILGGSSSFSNRLTDSVRVKGGLAYEIWSVYTFGPKGQPGLFEVHAKTRNETVDKALSVIGSEIEKIKKDGVTKDELQRAKDAILKGLVFRYETPSAIVSAIANFVNLGYPKNYIEIYGREIGKVTIDQVNAAAKKYLHPDLLKVVIVGK